MTDRTARSRLKVEAKFYLGALMIGMIAYHYCHRGAEGRNQRTTAIKTAIKLKNVCEDSTHNADERVCACLILAGAIPAVMSEWSSTNCETLPMRVSRTYTQQALTLLRDGSQGREMSRQDIVARCPLDPQRALALHEECSFK